jgi:putative flippase GtrA
MIRSHPRRVAAFVGIGAVNTAIDISAFACLYELIGLDVISSNMIAFLIALTNSYIMNRAITFADRRGNRGTLKGFARFVVVAVAAMCVSTAIVYLVSLIAHALIGKLIATAASTVISYMGSYWFAFAPGSNAGQHTFKPSK